MPPTRGLEFYKLGFRVDEAAHLIGVSPSKFRLLVGQGRMPKARKVDNCAIWRCDELVDAFNCLTNDTSTDEWSDVLGQRDA